jgi:hypothetical protein
MLQTSTLHGLDEALRDLRRAIDTLPAGDTKKRLLRRYKKLLEVRERLTGRTWRVPWGLLTGICLGLGLAIAIALAMRSRDRFPARF